MGRRGDQKFLGKEASSNQKMEDGSLSIIGGLSLQGVCQAVVITMP
jgi:hypothetical protein